MTARPAFIAGLLACLGAWACVTIIPAIEAGGAFPSLEKLLSTTADRWLELAVWCLLAYALATMGTTTMVFVAQLKRVSMALRRLGLRAAAHPPTIQDWYDAVRGTELAPLSNRLLALPNSPGSGAARQPLVTLVPFDASVARIEIGTRYARRLATLQVWSAVALLTIGSALFLMGLPSALQSAFPEIYPWLPACATLALYLVLAAVVALIAERADVLATTISRLPLAEHDLESVNVLSSRGLLARGISTEKTQLSEEIAELRVKLIDLLERQHEDVVAALRHGLRDGLLPLSQGLVQYGGGAAGGDREQIGTAITAAFNSLMDKIEERTAGPLAEAKRLLEATSRAATSLSRAVARLRYDGAEHERSQNERAAILAEGLISRKPEQLAGVLEQLDSGNRSMIEAQRSVLLELGTTIRDGIARLADVNAETQRQTQAQQQTLQRDIAKLADTVEALSARLIPGLRRLSVVDERVGAALDRHDGIAVRGQALMEELAGLLEGIRGSLERVVDTAAQASRSSPAVGPQRAAVPQAATPASPTLRDELAALLSDFEETEPDRPPASRREPTQPPS